MGPSGVPSCSPPVQLRHIGWSLKPDTGSHVAPWSVLRNSPCGEVPAYQAPGSLAWPGVSQNTWSTTRPVSPSGALSNAGGRVASVQLRPPSAERNTVGPRWPVRAAISIRDGARGSCTIWWMVWPRKVGPAACQWPRAASLVRVQAPLVVATSSVIGPVSGNVVIMAPVRKPLNDGSESSTCRQCSQSRLALTRSAKPRRTGIQRMGRPQIKADMSTLAGLCRTNMA
ncbi:hypothetical protein D9M68_493390 [compost metagenome]